MLIQCLKNYCDMIWEYDCTQKRIYIHYDIIAKGYANKSYTPEELVHDFKEKYKLDTTEYMWKKYLNGEYLNHFFEGGDRYEEFEIQFIANDSQLMWYYMRVERAGEDRLILSGKNMYNEFKERSLYDSIKEAFENIVSIDVQAKTCVVIHAKRISSVSAKAHNYDDMMKVFVDNYAAEDDKERFKREMSLDYVVEKLKSIREYSVYINIMSSSGEKTCKKVTFSYADKAGSFITFSTINIGEIVGRYERLLRESRKENFTDSLTGTYNRNYYEKNIKLQNFSGGVAVLDIDDFKLCNDTHGHATGDMMLIGVADAIRAGVSHDDMIIRFGGDEFLVLMPEATSEILEERLERIQELINKSNDSAKFTVSLSIGGVIAKNEIAQEAVYRADRLMYRAKLRKNSVVTEENFYLHRNKDDDMEINKQILVVDNSPPNRRILSDMISDDFEVLEAIDGKKCMKFLKEYGTGISLILLDIDIPEPDGIEILSEMNRLNYIDDIPVIIITEDAAEANIRKAFSLGAADCICRPYDSKVVMQRICNTVKLYSKQRRLVSIITRQLSENENNSRIMLDVLSGILGRKNGESAMHIQHIRKITAMLLERLILKTDKYGLSWHDCEMISEAAVLHDIGKIETDGKILNKPGALTRKEREEVQKHTVIGEEMIKKGAETSIKDEPMLEIAAKICRSHHERYDGKGYPDGLSGEEIPIAAQVVALADVYDALVSKRVYKEAYSGEKALDMILSGECGSFNPLIVECLCDISDKLTEDIYSQKQEE